MDPFFTPIMRLLRNAAQFPTKHLLQQHVLFSTMLLLLLLCQVPSVHSDTDTDIADTMFKRVSLSGTYLKLFNTQDFSHYQPRSPGFCAFWCAERQNMSPGRCEAFEPNTDGTCDFYKMLVVRYSHLLRETDRHVFINERSAWRDVFHDFQLRGKKFSIYFSSVKKNMDKAHIHCNDIGGYLLEFDSLDEYDAVKMVTRDATDRVYVGYNDIDNEMSWVVDRGGLPVDSSTWLWYGTEPNGSRTENCALLDLRYMRHVDYDCSFRTYVLCERDV